MVDKLPIISLIVLIVAVIIFIKPIKTNIKALLLISQEFPQIPIKPLHLLTSDPRTEQLTLGENNMIRGDVKSPQKQGRYPGIILAMGVRTSEKDKPVLLGFADTLARLGYVVIWPHSQLLDEDKIGLEDPQTFKQSFNYLEGRSDVESERISFVGFSVGSSLAMVASEEKEIADKVHGFVFFGGYFNLFDYLKTLATSKFTVNGKEVSWQPQEGAITHAQKVLEFEDSSLDIFKESAINTEIITRLSQLSPDTNIKNFKARLFILHERNDHYVPWIESEKLHKATGGRLQTTFHLSSLFEHAQTSKEKFNVGMIKEFLELYLFLYRTLNYL